jgi:hypothetical protein
MPTIENTVIKYEIQTTYPQRRNRIKAMPQIYTISRHNRQHYKGTLIDSYNRIHKQL